MHIWEEFLVKQERFLGKSSVDQWLRSLKVVHFDSGNLYLEAKDSFQVLWFEEHIRPKLKSELLNNNFRPIKVHLTVAEMGAPSPAKVVKKGKNPSPTPLQFIRDPLNSDCTLENFIAGTHNAVVYRLFCELSGYQPLTKKYDQPTVALGAFNPIYLWGSSGSGKTHLLMALAQAFKKRGLNALYAKSETFTEHVVAAIRSSEMQAFRKAYRNVDVLLIDDIHVLGRKDATQEEFFHTFNTLHTSGRQIILTAKCTPALLQDIEPRLISRFEWGINVHFEKLEAEDLKQVLKQRCDALHFPLSEEVSSFLIQSFPSSKSLQRALEALILRCHLSTDARLKRDSQILNKEGAIRMLSDLLEQERKIAPSPEKIIAIISALYGIRNEDLLGKSQSQECSYPRQIAMYLCRDELKLPYQSIGRVFDRDHSTVMTSIKQIEKRMRASDKELLASLAEIKSHLEI
jgi:chromosomal replication initiator protein